MTPLKPFAMAMLSLAVASHADVQQDKIGMIFRHLAVKPPLVGAAKWSISRPFLSRSEVSSLAYRRPSCGLVSAGSLANIAGSLLTPHAGDVAWRVAFLAGLIFAPILYGMSGGVVPTIVVQSSAAVVIFNGFLVGFGTRLGSGCTSGHGVCGVARLSPRSVAATDLFMAGAIPTAAIGYRIARFCRTPFCASAFAAPSQSKIDGRLIGGAVLFGVGWGSVCYCPGPALPSIGLGNSATLFFVAAMLIGMTGFAVFQSLTARRLRQA